MHQLTTPEQRFADLLAVDASHPFVTYYDEASGERSELSAKSLANWVAKTHHLLTDELGLGVGDTALVAVPPHWISLPVVLGCLSAGLALEPASGDVAFVAEPTLGVADGTLDRYVIAVDAAAVGFGDDAPGGASDYVAAVRPQADAWAGVHRPAGGDDACLAGLTRAEAMARATERAAEIGLADAGRLLTTRDWNTPQDWIDAVLCPLVVGGSLVIVRNCSDEDVLTRRAEQERATARL